MWSQELDLAILVGPFCLDVLWFCAFCSVSPVVSAHREAATGAVVTCTHVALFGCNPPETSKLPLLPALLNLCFYYPTTRAECCKMKAGVSLWMAFPGSFPPKKLQLMPAMKEQGFLITNIKPVQRCSWLVSFDSNSHLTIWGFSHKLNELKIYPVPNCASAFQSKWIGKNAILMWLFRSDCSRTS